MGTEHEFIRRVLITVAIVLGAAAFVLMFWLLSRVLLLVFGAILVAVMLGGFAYPLYHFTPLPRWAAVLFTTLFLLLLLGAGAYFAGPAIAIQVSELTQQLPGAEREIRAYLEQYRWGDALLGWAQSSWRDASVSPSQILGGVTGTFSTLFGTLGNLLVVFVVGFYLALDPSPYVQGLLNLIPGSKRQRVQEVLDATGHALRLWLVGRGLSMLVVGILTAIGLWIVDVPLVLALAVIAALFSFVPFLGPIASAVPAVLVGLVQSPAQALNVALVYGVVQLLESNIITPLVQVRAVSLLPAIMLSGQVIMGVLFGLIGLLLATPLLVTLIVPIQMLYVQDVLKARVTPLGQ